eukprot:TRINITY_DN2586_c0_g1_i3.p1 TRINITY_DN2586_c0_g1~~TRINITY_DN2586_c0_g1_i3.p1  ORF type:complete len:835 (-),score=226.32 TRINITY_DN2586_c0_g1_i3:20-2524(-)
MSRTPHDDFDPVNFKVDLGFLEDLDLTTENIDFDEFGDELEKFQQDQVLRVVLSKGVDLRQYARQIEHELQTAEDDSIKDYIEAADSLAILHKSIKTCDGTLDTMEKMLVGFQHHLGSLSSELKNLQNDTLSLNVKLQNRKSVESTVSNLLDNLNVNASLAAALNDQEVDEKYMEPMKQLAEKLEFASQHKQTAVVREVSVVLERLRAKVVGKVRQFLLLKITAITKPRQHLRMKQAALCKFSYFYEFLSAHAPDVAQEIRTAYIDTVGMEYFNNIKGYFTSLSKYKTEDPVDRKEWIGTDESRTGGLFSMGRRNTEQINKIFYLNDRDKILQELHQEPINATALTERSPKVAFESIFRSTLTMLMDYSAPEFTFINQFFSSRTLFTLVIRRTTDFLTENVQHYLFNCSDLISILLLIRIVNAHQAMLARQRSSCLDFYFNSLQQTLWPRFQSIFDLNLQSIPTAKFVNDKNAPSRPHFVTIRYAWLCTAIRVLSQNVVPVPIFMPGRPAPRKPLAAATSSSSSSSPGSAASPSPTASSPSPSTAPAASPASPPASPALSPSAENKENKEGQENKENKEGNESKEGAQPDNKNNEEDGDIVQLVGGVLEEQVQRNLVRMRQEVERLCARCATEIAVPKLQSIFLINNYDFVWNSLKDRGLDCEETQRFGELLDKYIQLYVEEELNEKFGRLLSFVKQTELAFGENKRDGDSEKSDGPEDDGKNGAEDQPSLPRLDNPVVEAIIKGFASTWKDCIEKLQINIIQCFSNHQSGLPTQFRTGEMVLKRVLYQLLYYYDRFENLVKKHYNTPALVNAMVPMHAVKFVVKKYVNQVSRD